ncbi:hypothetical protein LINPERPRIM_LOCUS16626 [Linum perenne]
MIWRVGLRLSAPLALTAAFVLRRRRRRRRRRKRKRVKKLGRVKTMKKKEVTKMSNTSPPLERVNF